MSLNDVVLDVVKDKGPLLPAEIVSEVSKVTGKQTDMFFMGAVLSELMAEKHVKMSYAKIGGSRLYYCPGQEEKLSRVYDYINSKEQKAYDLLKEKKVLRNSEQEPVMRVALFELKDFAKSIDVNLNGTERFWYWFSLPIEDAKSMIKDILKNEINASNTKDDKTKPESEPSKNNSEDTDKDNHKSMRSNSQNETESESGFIRSSERSTDFKRDDEKLDGDNDSFISSSSVPNNKKEQQSKLSAGLDSDDEFMKKVLIFFETKEIHVIDGSVLKKKSDCEFNVNVKSQVGKLRFYVYAKSKKKITETDLGYAYVRSQNNHLPLCFVSDGELTKKAVEFLENELNSATFLKM